MKQSKCPQCGKDFIDADGDIPDHDSNYIKCIVCKYVLCKECAGQDCIKTNLCPDHVKYLNSKEKQALIKLKKHIDDSEISDCYYLYIILISLFLLTMYLGVYSLTLIFLILMFVGPFFPPMIRKYLFKKKVLSILPPLIRQQYNLESRILTEKNFEK